LHSLCVRPNWCRFGWPVRVVSKLLRVQWSQVSHKSDPRNSKDGQVVLVLIRGRDSPAPMRVVYLVLYCVDEVKQIYEWVGIGHEHGYYDLFSTVEECVVTIK
jgi:hypothetical protein